MTYKTFKETLAKYVNMDEIIYDAALVLFALFFRRVFFPGGITVIDVLNPVSAIFLVLLIDIFVSFFLGELYQRYKTIGEKHPWTVKAVIVIIFLTLAGVYFILNETLRGLKILTDTEAIIPYAAGLFMIYAGFTWSLYKKEKAGCEFSLIIFSFPVCASFIFFMLYFEPIISLPLSMIIAFAASSLYWVFLNAFPRLWDKFFNKESKAAGRLRTVFFTFFLPIMIVLTTGFCQEIFILGQISVSPQGVSAGRVFLSLVLFGIIPVRILLAAAPPYRLINSGIGIISLGVYFISIYSFVSAHPAGSFLIDSLARNR